MTKLLSIIRLLSLCMALAACAGQPTPPPSDPAGPAFNLTISGATSGTLAPPESIARFSAESFDDAATAYTLWFGGPDQDVTTAVMFYGSAAPAAGTYAISELDMQADSLDGQVAAIVIAQINGELITFAIAEGTITLEAVGDSYSGSLEFTATGATDAAQTVTISGTFSAIPLIANN